MSARVRVISMQNGQVERPTTTMLHSMGGRAGSGRLMQAGQSRSSQAAR